MVKVAVIGIGKMGISHLSILGGMDNARVVGVADTSSWITHPLKKYSTFDVYSNYEELLQEKEPEAVIVSVPTRFHSGMVETLIQQGIHVFVEKPLTMNPEHSRSLVNLAKKYRVVNQVGYHNRFISTFREARKIVAEGILGKPVHFMAEAYGPVVTKKQQGTWRFRPNDGGGCLMDYASHVLDLIAYIISPVREVQGTQLKSIYSDGVEDAVFALLETKSNISGVLQINWSEPSYRKMSTSLTIQGTEGKLIVDATEVKLFLNQPNDNHSFRKGWNIINHVHLTKQPAFFLRGEEYSLQLEYFIESVEKNKLNEINNFEQAALTDEVIHRIRNHHNRNNGTNHFWG